MRLAWALLFVLITFSVFAESPNKENACPLSASIPLSEDFSTGVPPSNWEVNNPDGSEGWELATAVGSDGNSTQVARMDNYQYNSAGQLDDLVMPSVDISAYSNPKLIFDVAYAPFGASNYERLHIEYSTDCGSNYTATTYDKSHLDLATVSYQTTGWEPQSASDWRTDTLDLSAYSSTQTIFKFIQTAGYGNGLFIDNVRIEPTDPPVASFSSSTTIGCTTDTLTFTDLSTDIPTAWTWSFSPSTVTYQNGTSATSQHPQVIFDASGSYSVTLTATNAYGANTTAIQTTSIFGSASIPFSEDFSTGVPPSEWLVINPDGSKGWEVTTNIGSDGNSTQVARMDNYQYNSPGQLDDLVMPSIDISSYSYPKLVFDVAYAPFGATNYERLHIEYSTDCGANFSLTTYDKSHLDLATVSYQTNGWGPSSASDWRTDTLDLSAYTSTQMILKFVQTAGYGNGLFIDNVRIINYDINALSLDATVMLEGPYNNGVMNTDLATNNYIPLVEPYTAMGWHSGGETTTTTVLSNFSVVDWVLVELRDKTTNTLVVETQAALLLADGKVVGVNGVDELFWTVSADDYYIVIRHRNHLAAMTLSPVTFTTSTTIDFSTTSLYGGTLATNTLSGVQVLWAGDGSSDGQINAADRSQTWNERNQTGYYNTDCQLNGTVDAGDRSTTWNNRNHLTLVP